MSEIDEPGDDEAMVVACVQELDEFVARKLRRYPIDAVAVAASSYLAGLLGVLFDERQFTADEVRELLREIDWKSSIRSVGPELAAAGAPPPLSAC